MEKVYEEIRELDIRDKCSISEAVMKFNEEFGELCQEINKTTGRKLTDETPEELRANILSEMADSLQNLLLISSRFNLGFDEICE